MSTIETTAASWKDLKQTGAPAHAAVTEPGAAPRSPLLEAAAQLDQAERVQAAARKALLAADRDVSAKKKAMVDLAKGVGKIGVEKRAKAKK